MPSVSGKKSMAFVPFVAMKETWPQCIWMRHDHCAASHREGDTVLVLLCLREECVPSLLSAAMKEVWPLCLLISCNHCAASLREGGVVSVPSVPMMDVWSLCL